MLTNKKLDDSLLLLKRILNFAESEENIPRTIISKEIKHLFKTLENVSDIPCVVANDVEIIDKDNLTMKELYSINRKLDSAVTELLLNFHKNTGIRIGSIDLLINRAVGSKEEDYIVHINTKL